MNQAELLALAQANKDSIPVVAAVLASITEAQMTARTALGSVGAASKTLREGVDFQDGFCVMLDNSSFVADAAKASAAMTRMAADLTTLASILQQAGFDVSY